MARDSGNSASSSILFPTVNCPHLESEIISLHCPCRCPTPGVIWHVFQQIARINGDAAVIVLILSTDNFLTRVPLCGLSTVILCSSCRRRISWDSFPWTSLICVSSPKCVYMCVKRCPSQTPNAFICVSPNAFVCVSPNAFICVSPNAFICVSPNAFICVSPIRLLNPQRSSLRSLTFARFARTFFNSLN